MCLNDGMCLIVCVMFWFDESWIEVSLHCSINLIAGDGAPAFQRNHGLDPWISCDCGEETCFADLYFMWKDDKVGLTDVT